MNQVILPAALAAGVLFIGSIACAATPSSSVPSLAVLPNQTGTAITLLAASGDATPSLYERSEDSSWTRPKLLPSLKISGTPAIVRSMDVRLYTNDNSQLNEFRASSDLSKWTTGRTPVVRMQGNPCAVADGARFYVFARDAASGRLFEMLGEDGGNLTKVLGIDLWSRPATADPVCAAASGIWIATATADGSLQVGHSLNGHNWTVTSLLSAGAGPLLSAETKPAIAVSPTGIDILAVNAGGLLRWRYSLSGNSWSGAESVPVNQGLRPGSLAAAWNNSDLVIFGQTDDGRTLVMTGSAGGSTWKSQALSVSGDSFSGAMGIAPLVTGPVLLSYTAGRNIFEIAKGPGSDQWKARASAVEAGTPEPDPVSTWSASESTLGPLHEENGFCIVRNVIKAPGMTAIHSGALDSNLRTVATVSFSSSQSPATILVSAPPLHCGQQPPPTNPLQGLALPDDVMKKQNLVSASIYAANENSALVGGFWRSQTPRTVWEALAAQSGAFLSQAGSFLEIPCPGCFSPKPVAINQAAQIVVQAQSSDGGIVKRVSFVQDFGRGTQTSIRYPGLVYPGFSMEKTYATGISRNGDVVGYYADPAENRLRGFIRSASGLYTTIDDSRIYSGETLLDWISNATMPLAINSFGEVVGYFTRGSDEAQAIGFYYFQGRFQILQPKGSNYSRLTGISDNGQFVGDFVDAQGPALVHGVRAR